MPLEIIRNDITKMKVDAIVNAANTMLTHGGGVCGSIHRAAGEELAAECKLLGGCKVGEAKITKGYRLPCRYVIHTVGPRWFDGKRDEKELLTACYTASLSLAVEHACESVAFPLLSSGAFGYPKDQALRTAVDAISTFLMSHDLQVYLVVFDRASYQIGEELASDIKAFIDDRYVTEHTVARQMEYPCAQAPAILKKPKTKKRLNVQECGEKSVPLQPFATTDEFNIEDDLKIKLKNLDESFSQMLLRKIDEKGMTDAACYKKANIDRKLFSKIRGDVHYKPSKPTAVAFAIALELSLNETKEMLQKAGFALSHSSVFDLIIEYFIQKRNYNIFQINEVLFAFDQSLLGGQ